MRKALLPVMFTLCAGIAHAADDANDPYSALEEIVTIAPRDPKSDDCEIRGTVDFARYTDNLPVFREAFLNRDFSVDFYRQRQRQVFVHIILKREAELITEGLYNGDHADLDCKFSLRVSYNDKFGQDRTFEALTWRFDREQAAKMNWENLDPKDFNKVALDYSLSSHLSDWISDESKLGSDSPVAEGQATSDECDMLMFNANAVFIGATTFCKKDYMDSKEGLAALAGARKCMAMGEVEMKEKAGAAMLTLDRIAKERGKPAVCPFVEGVAKQVRTRMQKRQ